MQKEKSIEEQRIHLQQLESERELSMMEARHQVLMQKARERRSRTGSVVEACPQPRSQSINSIKDQDPPAPANKPEPATGGPQLAWQEPMALSRLPVPEPSVFYGDPLKFIEWSLSFRALIERRCPYPADRLFYLQRYVGGEAKASLEGSFYRKDEAAYQQAWDRLNARYGHPFIVQRAFRDRLNGWPRIGAGEYNKLRAFSDFLLACDNAIPHVNGLQVLNDCEENRKLLTKLPDWITSCWNRIVTEQLDEGKDYPSFHQFALFIDKEARIACNPISSLLALNCSLGGPLNTRGTRARVFATNVERAPQKSRDSL